MKLAYRLLSTRSSANAMYVVFGVVRIVVVDHKLDVVHI